MKPGVCTGDSRRQEFRINLPWFFEDAQQESVTTGWQSSPEAKGVFFSYLVCNFFGHCL
jgi:hypothetical protein